MQCIAPVQLWMQLVFADTFLHSPTKNSHFCFQKPNKVAQKTLKVQMFTRYLKVLINLLPVG